MAPRLSPAAQRIFDAHPSSPPHRPTRWISEEIASALAEARSVVLEADRLERQLDAIAAALDARELTARPTPSTAEPIAPLPAAPGALLADPPAESSPPAPARPGRRLAGARRRESRPEPRRDPRSSAILLAQRLQDGGYARAEAARRLARRYDADTTAQALAAVFG